MTTAAATATAPPRSASTPPPRLLAVGRTFVHPAFDYLLIGGGLSLIVAALAWLGSAAGSADVLLEALPFIFLLSNSTHFAASTVRLYTKEDSFRAMPFLTLLFPLVTIAVATVAIAFPRELGRHLTSLFLTWSPYHYSAQAYGLAVMYCYRTGLKLTDRQKWPLWACCMLTFAKTAIGAPLYAVGVWWIVPWTWASSHPAAQSILDGAVAVLGVAAFTLPFVLYAWILRSARSPMPAISLLIVLTNAIWFFAFKYISAVVWATVFHGVQYLAIVTIFHVKDQTRKSANRRGWVHHTLCFYAVSLALAYLIFQCWPSVYVLCGFGYVESSILVVAVINIHHFIVDRAIWRLRRDPNYRTVTSAAPV